MARKRSATLTEAEMRLMEVLWDRYFATVAEVLEALPKKPRLAYSTVLTTLRILERKGYVAHEKKGRAFVYRPLVDRRSVRRKAVRHLVSRFFNNSAASLVLSILETERLDPEDLRLLRKMIEESE